MKKLSLVMMVLMLVAILAGCSSEEATSTSTTEAAAEKVEETAAAEESAEKLPGEGATKLGVLLVGTRDDYGYNQGLYNCAIETKDTLGLEVFIKESVPEDSSAQAVMEQMIAEGCTIIFASSYGHREYAEEVARNHPEVAFLVTNTTGEDLPNMVAIVNNLWDAAYVNGVAAGLMTETNELGYIGSFQIPTVIASMNAFALGAQSVNPDATVHAVFTGSWGDVGLQTNAVNGMISQNIDCIANYQDFTKTIVEMCEDAGVYAIGYHVDTSELAPNSYVIGTLDNFVGQNTAFENAISGNFTTETIRGGYNVGMADNTDFGDIVPEEVQAEVNAVIDVLTSGEFSVFAGPIYNQAGEIAIEDGVVLTDAEIDGMDYFVQGVIGQDQ